MTCNDSGHDSGHDPGHDREHEAGPAINQSGFTLMEMLIAAVLLSIILTLGVGGYARHLERTHRTDATRALLGIAAAQERFYLDNNRYADNLAALGFAPSSERGFYTLVIDTDESLQGYRASARAHPDKRQNADRHCQVLTIDQSGRRDATGESSTQTARENCWR